MEASGEKDDLGRDRIASADTLIVCPLCEGQPYLDPFVGHSQECPLCEGAGIVDTDAVCLCGRPAFRRINEIDLCWRKECAERAEPTKTSKAWPEMSDEE